MPKYAGIVEGFFSAPLPPWSFRERGAVIAFCAEQAPLLNAYFYCPKDDPYVRERWNALYPEQEAADLAAFIADCRRRGMTFIYGFNPALPDERGPRQTAQWSEEIFRKARQLQELGGDLLCLLFDDVPLSYDAVEKRLDSAHAQAEEFLVLALCARDAARRAGYDPWLCTPDYSFCRQSALTHALRGLTDSVLVWTGRGVFVPRIEPADLAAARANLGPNARLLHWSNYPVNDVEQNVSVLNLGGFPALPAEVCRELEGLFVNPMRQCFANLPFYLSLAAQLAAPAEYNREQQWHRSLAALLGAHLSPLGVLIDQFSACSVVDGAPKHFHHALLAGANPDQLARQIRETLRLLPEAAAAALSARRFLHAIERVFIEARRFADFAERISGGGALTLEEFRREDSFPTVPSDARNVKEVIDIAAARTAAAGGADGQGSAFAALQALGADFVRRYPGRQRLSISAADTACYLEAIRTALRMEQTHMVQVLNDSRRDAAERLRAYALRQSLNRFTLHASWARTSS